MRKRDRKKFARRLLSGAVMLNGTAMTFGRACKAYRPGYAIRVRGRAKAMAQANRRGLTMLYRGGGWYAIYVPGRVA